MGERTEHRANKRGRRAAAVKRLRRRKISLRFEDVDMRTREATRMKLASLVAEFGAEANPDTLRELAVHRLALEAAQAGAIAGMAKASERAVRHSNVILRLERSLRRLSKARRPAGPSLAEYLARAAASASPVGGLPAAAGIDLETAAGGLARGSGEAAGP
jgi:hypothetical protein